MAPLFKGKPIIAFRRNNNLKQLLCNTNTITNPSEKGKENRQIPTIPKQSEQMLLTNIKHESLH